MRISSKISFIAGCALVVMLIVFPAAGCRRAAEEKHAEDTHAVAKTDAHKADDHDADHDEHEGEDKDAHKGEEHDKHTEKAADGHAHNEADSVRLSSAAQANVGVKAMKASRKTFERTITAPAIVVELSGRSHVQIAAPLTGVVTAIYHTLGETVSSGQPMFDLRLTHEEVVEAQGAFLQTAEELDVVRREIERLEHVTATGAVAGKTLLERKYEEQKLEVLLRSQRQRLLLHGLSEQQVDGILSRRALLSELTVFAPGKKTDADRSLTIEELKVDKGQHVRAGDLLCSLVDYSQLCIQGKAFEQDAPALEKAANENWPTSAVIAGGNQRPQIVPGLKIISMSNRVDPESRALSFYVELPNEVIRDRREPDGRRYCTWRFKPGQRMEVLVPVERWPDRIVLPRDAVVQDGPESYIFEKNGDHFDRRAIRIEYQDQYNAVLAGDSIAPNKEVVVAGAYQIHLALKNKSGGAIDPHAGHNH